MNTRFLYFAYGSNMLTARLQDRCPSAEVLSVGELPGYTLDFSKPSKDGSGKATPRLHDDEVLSGVLFCIECKELTALDKAEGQGKGYERKEVSVRQVPSRIVSKAVTYFATCPKPNLRPYDWYWALVLAGAKQHQLPKHHQMLIENTETAQDLNTEREARRNAIRVLEESGFGSIMETK